MPSKRYRLVTRSDFDGLVCAVLLKQLDLIDEIIFAHPKDMQDGKVPITNQDIITNLPYVEGCHLAFDHHISELIRNRKNISKNHIIQVESPSAARVVFNHFGGTSTFGKRWDTLLSETDKSDLAEYKKNDILKPSGWALLNFLVDPRTGLGRFRDFRISNYQLMFLLIDECSKCDINELLELPDVKERIKLYFSYETQFKEQLNKCSTVHDNLLVINLKDEPIIYPGSRFMAYALFPEANVSVHILWGLRKQNTVFAFGRSVINRTSSTNIGELMLKYGGGGHENAGTCQIPNDQADRVLGELIARINADG